MKVIVDTDVWIEAFKKGGDGGCDYVRELRELVEDDRVQMVGQVRMEILCGVQDQKQFNKLKAAIAAFPDRPLDHEVYELAANMFNHCRLKGDPGPMSDFIICASSMLWKMPILTMDEDYQAYRKHLPIELHQPR